MTLQQLRYVIAIAESGSITGAAARLFVTQPSLSCAVADLEEEMHITLFTRSSRGMKLTEEGVKFLSYARAVVQQADVLEHAYRNSAPQRRVFAVSSQHYAFVVSAFAQLVDELGRDRFEFVLRETQTARIIEDVRTHKSELGVLYLSHFNREVLEAAFKRADLEFVGLCTASPHVLVTRDHPLAHKTSVHLDDLADYVRLTYDQGMQNSFYFAEELHATVMAEKNIVVTDRATLFNLLSGVHGYTISSGILSPEFNGDGIVSIPLSTDEEMELGYLTCKDLPLSSIAERYIQHLSEKLDVAEAL